MRWIVVLLILANAGLYGWFSYHGPDNVTQIDEGRLPRVAEIELIGRQADAKRSERAEERDAPSTTPSAVRTDSVPTTSGEVAALPGEARACFGVGWFSDKEEAVALRDSLISSQERISFRAITERTEELEPFHWVLIPPLETRQQALERYRELVDQGVEAYVVPSGEQENAISLGLFRSLQSARDLLQRRQQEKINAALVMFPRNRISYALVFEGSPESVRPIVEGLSADGAGDVQLIEISACKGVATAKKNP